MTSPGNAAPRSVPRPASIAIILSLTDHGTTGVISDAGAALINLHDDDSVGWHEGLLKIEVKTLGGKGGTPTAVGASDTFSVFYAFTDSLLDHVTEAPVVLATCEESLVCALPNAVSVRATGTLTISGTPSAGETITIGDRVYVLEGDDLPLYYNYIRISTDADTMRDRIIGAINADPSYVGDTVGAGTVAHANVTAASGGAGVVTVRAVDYGVAGNFIATTETATDVAFGAATLTGGSSAGTAIHQTDPFVYGGKYLYIWYDRTAFAANALIDVEAKLVRL